MNPGGVGATASTCPIRAPQPAKRQLEAMGGRFVAFWMTLGEHDMVLVYETPDDAVAARFTLVLNGLGSVRTRTMKAFPEAAYRGIMASLG